MFDSYTVCVKEKRVSHACGCRGRVDVMVLLQLCHPMRCSDARAPELRKKKTLLQNKSFEILLKQYFY